MLKLGSKDKRKIAGENFDFKLSFLSNEPNIYKLITLKSERKTKMRRNLMVLTVIVLAVLCVKGNAQSVFRLDQKVEKAVLEEDWTKVTDILGPDDSLKAPAVARLIKGHACLALNRNNESLCLFLSVTSESDLKKWKSWTQKFVKQNPQSAIAYYFEGDAFARLEQWDSALVTLDKGLQLDSTHALILNARGVIQAAKGELDTAYAYLAKAIVADSSLADAYASFGALWIQRKTGAKGALEAFDQALKISPDFVSALYGRGCVKSILRKWTESKEDLENAIAKAGCLSEFILSNIAQTLVYVQKSEESIVAPVDSLNPSYEIDRRLSAMERSGNTGFMGSDYKALVGVARNYPQYQSYIRDNLNKLAQNNPNFDRNLSRTQLQVENHNRWGQFWGNILKRTDITQVKGLLPATGGSWATLCEKNLSTMQNISLKQYDLTKGVSSKMDLSWEEGNWPFSTQYGLFYKPRLEETSPTTQTEPQK
jgi:tetratricopeptide (TPR) repeat protein